MLYKEKSLCTGCCACYNSCPKKCVLMKEDSEGFGYPEIDKNKCINCGLCNAVCHKTILRKSLYEPHSYACINKNEEVQMLSSSGGIFSLLAENIIDKEGVVFGAAFDDSFNVEHIAIVDKADLGKIRGSKYVQSRIGTTYVEARRYLDAGKIVLFTGTPCQIEGLLKFLGKDYDNLYTQDIICHGVASPDVWRRYLKFREKKAESKVKRVSFRDKKMGWKSFAITIEFESGQIYIEKNSVDPYMKGFLSNLYLRPSCYSCQYRNIRRNSDFTLADFWGVETIHPEMYSDKGTSLVIVNSDKGEALFSGIRAKMLIKDTGFEEALSLNPAALQTLEVPKTRKKVLRLLSAKNFDVAINKCYKGTYMQRLLSKMRRTMMTLDSTLKKCKR